MIIFIPFIIDEISMKKTNSIDYSFTLLGNYTGLTRVDYDNEMNNNENSIYIVNESGISKKYYLAKNDVLVDSCSMGDYVYFAGRLTSVNGIAINNVFSVNSIGQVDDLSLGLYYSVNKIICDDANHLVWFGSTKRNYNLNQKHANYVNVYRDGEWLTISDNLTGPVISMSKARAGIYCLLNSNNSLYYINSLFKVVAVKSRLEKVDQMSMIGIDLVISSKNKPGYIRKLSNTGFVQLGSGLDGNINQIVSVKVVTGPFTQDLDGNKLNYIAMYHPSLNQWESLDYNVTTVPKSIIYNSVLDKLLVIVDTEPVLILEYSFKDKSWNNSSIIVKGILTNTVCVENGQYIYIGNIKVFDLMSNGITNVKNDIITNLAPPKMENSDKIVTAVWDNERLYIAGSFSDNGFLKVIKNNYFEIIKYQPHVTGDIKTVHYSDTMKCLFLGGNFKVESKYFGVLILNIELLNNAPEYSLEFSNDSEYVASLYLQKDSIIAGGRFTSINTKCSTVCALNTVSNEWKQDFDLSGSVVTIDGDGKDVLYFGGDFTMEGEQGFTLAKKCKDGMEYFKGIKNPKKVAVIDENRSYILSYDLNELYYFNNGEITLIKYPKTEFTDLMAWDDQLLLTFISTDVYSVGTLAIGQTRINPMLQADGMIYSAVGPFVPKVQGNPNIAALPFIYATLSILSILIFLFIMFAIYKHRNRAMMRGLYAQMNNSKAILEDHTIWGQVEHAYSKAPNSSASPSSQSTKSLHWIENISAKNSSSSTVIAHSSTFPFKNYSKPNKFFSLPNKKRIPKKNPKRYKLVRAKCDYVAKTKADLSFKQGDIIELICVTEMLWWYGRLQRDHEQKGTFPMYITEPIEKIELV